MKSKILAEIRERKGVTGEAAENIFNTTFEALRAVIEREGSARVPGFGTFKKKHRPGRTVRNPRNGETIQTSAKDVITFKQSANA